VIVLDLETGVVCEPPQNLWDRVAATLALNPDQVSPRLAPGTPARALSLGCAWEPSTSLAPPRVPAGGALPPPPALIVAQHHATPL
jgi:hypothetical protein